MGPEGLEPSNTGGLGPRHMPILLQPRKWRRGGESNAAPCGAPVFETGCRCRWRTPPRFLRACSPAHRGGIRTRTAVATLGGQPPSIRGHSALRLRMPVPPLPALKNLVVGQGVEPCRRANPALSPAYKADPHSRCCPPKWRSGGVSSPGGPFRGHIRFQGGAHRRMHHSKMADTPRLELGQPLRALPRFQRGGLPITRRIQTGGAGVIRTHGAGFPAYPLSRRVR